MLRGFVVVGSTGFNALSVTAAEPIGGRLAEVLTRYLQPAVIICDDLGVVINLSSI